MEWQKRSIRTLNIHYFIIQLKSLLSMPFINSHYISEVLYIFPHEKHFFDKYLAELYHWMDSILSPTAHQVKKKYAHIIIVRLTYRTGIIERFIPF